MKFKFNYVIIPIITILVASLGSVLTNVGLANWYKTLNLPSWAPAGAVIGTVWTILYILATISALWVFNKADRKCCFKTIIYLFLVNAFLNVFWSYLFFVKHTFSGAFIEMIILDLTIVVLVYLIWPKIKWAAVLLIPYFLWVTFATYLTYVTWMLNK